jgi:hypothetical protein
LEEIIGTCTRIAEVLNRKRGLSIAMIRSTPWHLGRRIDPTEPKESSVRRPDPTQTIRPIRRRNGDIRLR